MRYYGQKIATNVAIFLLYNAASFNYAVANVWLRLPNCSGVVTQMPEMSDNDKALVITNGHCVRYTLQHEYTIEQKLTSDQLLSTTEKRKSRRMQRGEVIRDNYLISLLDDSRTLLHVRDDIYVYIDNNGGFFDKYVELTYSKIIFAKFQNVDIAVLELENTYLELKNKNIRYYPVAKTDPKESAEIVFHTANAALRKQLPPNMPISQVDQQEEPLPLPRFPDDRQFPERLKCKIEKYTPLLKEFTWTFKNYMRLQASPNCRFGPGVSGTAGIYNGEIVALASTGYEGGATMLSE
jgi:hypothetical protein